MPGQAQTPLVQVAPTGHALPHMPQLVGSFCWLTQMPLQLFGVMPPQAEHMPALHIAPTAQVLLQTPQLFVSVCRLTQALPQAVSPAPHWQRPPAHVAPGGQTLPHMPQLLASVCVSTQLPLQSVFGGLHPPLELELAIPPIPLEFELDVDAWLLLPPTFAVSPLPPQPPAAVRATMPESSTAQSNDSLFTIPTSGVGAASAAPTKRFPRPKPTCAPRANPKQSGHADMARR